ncbi:MAG: hypothetical protein WBQ94_16030 [Terracidiphilus sp.]
MKTVFVAPGGKKLIVLLASTCIVLMARNGEGQVASTGAQLAAIKLMQQQIGLDNNAPNQMNPNGLRIQFQKISEVQEHDGHLVRYRLLVPGAPEKQSYGLEVWRIGTDVQLTPQPVYTNAKGLLMWHEPTPREEDKDSLSAKEEIEVDLKVARGEPVRYMLASPDGKLFVPGTVVPYPAEIKSGNCRMEVRLGFPEGEGMLVYVDGLASGAAVPLQTVSGTETHAPHVIADTHGHAVAIVSPTVQGINAGVVKISLNIRACSLSLELPWGDGSYHPM